MENMFSFIPLATAAVICVAASISSLFALLLQKITKRSFGRYRLIAATLFLSGAVISMTLLLIFVPLPSMFSLYDAVYYGVLSALVFFGVLFFRKIGLPLLAVYIASCSFLIYSLSVSTDGESPRYIIEVQDESVSINENAIGISEEIGSAIAEKELLYMHCFAIGLPESLPLLAKPRWVYFSTLNTAPEKSFEIADMPISVVSKKILHVLALIEQKLADSKPYYNAYAIPILPVEFLPVMYQVQGSEEKGDFYFTITQLL